MKSTTALFARSVVKTQNAKLSVGKKLPAAIALAIGLAPASLPVTAAESRVALDEIVVTARKVEENLQETPVSVTVISSDAINNLSLTNIGEIQNVTPNLQFNSGFSGSSAGANFFIRGIGQLDFISTSDPGVALFVDGVYMARTVGSALDTADIERIEVLKGPQGTLFGKNTIGGAVNITTAKPSEEAGAFFEATIGNLGRYDGRFIANLPVSDTLFLKLTGVTRNNDGFQTRTTDGVELGDDGNIGGSFQAHWLASENLNVTFAADVTRRRAHIAAHGATTVIDSGGSDLYEAVTGVDPVDFQPAADPWEDGTTGVRPSDDLDVFGTSVIVNYDFGAVDLKSITAYRELEADTATDFDGTPIPYNDQLVNQDQEQFSQEFQLSRQTDGYKWVVGAYYLKEEIKEAIKNNFYLFYAFNGAPVGDGPVFETDLSTENFSLFGQLTYNLTNKLSATAGVRWNRESKDIDILSPFGLSSGGLPIQVSGDKTWENVSPRLGVEYQLHDDLMIYASATRGFKSGSFNGRPDRNNDFEPYAPEKVWAYETGFKSEFFDHRVRLNGAVFVTDYEGIQLITGGIDSNGVPFFPVDNAGDVQIQGAELELTARPMEALNLFASVGYTDEDWQEIYPVAFVTDSTRLPMMSHGTYILGGDYAVPLKNFGTLVLGANYSYRSAFFMDTNNSPRVEQDGYGLLDARIILKPASGNWQLKVWGKNLTDEEYITWAQDLIPIFDSHTVSFFGRPREYGVTFSVNF